MPARDPSSIIDTLPVVHAGGCARYGAGAETCRWKCGSQCAYPTPNVTENETFTDVLCRFVSRRSALRGAAAAAVALVAAPHLGRDASPAAAQSSAPAFTPITLANEDRIIVAEGYGTKVLLRWGDPLFPDAPAFDPHNQSAAAQERQFGYNNDFIGFFPITGAPDRALLAVNHEYTNPELMFPGYSANEPLRVQVEVELAAHGMTIVEIRRSADGSWEPVVDSPFNRRITGTTPMLLTGPAAGSPLLQTSEDSTGTIVAGMLNNCSAGKTPWGTVLTCEENFNQYFGNRHGLDDGDARKALHARYGLTAGASERKWERFYPRFDIAEEPNEAFRFGWTVEIDPYDGSFVPRKRTALGRLKHEAAGFLVGAAGRLAVYMGDDERFDYVYKFVTDRPMNGSGSNRDLLDSGTLYVARFNDDGTGEWIPLVAGQGALTADKGFATQADVLINTRQAADAVGATKMDRPEDIEISPVTKKIYMTMTNNTNRTAEQVDMANPRAMNRHGHIIEAAETGNDPTSTTFTWDMFMLCGPADDDSTYFAGFDRSQVSPISSPDNLIFDRAGNLWIFTDGQPGTIRLNDAVYAVPVEGPERGHLKAFLSVVPGAEAASGTLSDDNEALFVSIQHPGEGMDSTFGSPISAFPDGDFPRPSVVVAWKTSPGPKTIGS
jgi:secreted PhoX family phosphatase